MTVPRVCKPEKSDETKVFYSQNGVSRRLGGKCSDRSIMFLLFAKLSRNSNTVQSELSPIVQWMEFGPSPVTVLLNQNHFQYCVLPYIFFNMINYYLLV